MIPRLKEQYEKLIVPDIKKKFGVLAGFSDHTIGKIAPISSVALSPTCDFFGSSLIS